MLQINAKCKYPNSILAPPCVYFMAFSFSCFPSVGSFVLPRSGFGPSMLECMLKNMFESFNTLVCVCKKRNQRKHVM